MTTNHKRDPKDAAILRALILIQDTMILDISDTSKHESVTKEDLLKMFREGRLSWIFRHDPSELAETAIRVVNSLPPLETVFGEKLQGRASGLKNTVRLTLDGYSQAFTIESVFGILEDFEKATRITKEPWERKDSIRPIPEPFTKKEWLRVAHQYDSPEGIMADEQHLQVLENLAQAKVENNPKAVALWTDHAQRWDAMYQYSLTLDYEQIIEERKQRAIDKLAEDNKAIQALIKKGTKENLPELEHKNSRAIWDLFEKFSVTPKADMELYFTLYYANCIREGNTLEKEIELLKGELKARQDAFKLKYVKKDGMFRSTSHRGRQNKDMEQNRIERDEHEITQMLRYQPDIEKYLKEVNSTQIA